MAGSCIDKQGSLNAHHREDKHKRTGHVESVAIGSITGTSDCVALGGVWRGTV